MPSSPLRRRDCSAVRSPRRRLGSFAVGLGLPGTGTCSSLVRYPLGCPHRWRPPVKFGVVLFTSDRGITPARAAQAAEASGFDSFFVPEHTHIPVRRQAPHPQTGTQELPDDRYLRTLDPWVALSTAAAVTSTIRLGTAVALPAEHDPIALAKTIASLDHLSGGRVVLGAGF